MPMTVEPALQNQHGCNLVNHILAVTYSTPGGVQMPMGLGGAHPLVPQMHGQAEFRAQCVGEFLHSLRSRATVTGQMDGPANDNCRTVIASQQTTQRAQIIALVCMKDGQERLRSQA